MASARRPARLRSVVLAATLALAPAAARAATPEEVARSIAKGKAFLYLKEHGDNWEFTPKAEPKGAGYSESGGQWGGVTALCVWSLIVAGEDPRSPQLKPAVDWLKKAKITGVYAVGTRCQVWRLLPQTPEVKSLARADAEELTRGLNTTGAAKFLYGYQCEHRTPDDIDHSSSQFGVLGMWSCDQIVPELVPTSYWKNVNARWEFDQQGDGGWFYRNAPFDTGDHLHNSTQTSMTAAGVATLYLTQDYTRRDVGAKCGGNVTNPHIEAGLKYLIAHKADWTPDSAHFGTPVNEWYAGYTLFGIERVAVASGLKYLGDVDWYQYGADWCLKNQADSGSWNGDADVDNTAFCLLFLARGQAPVLIDKVQYDNADGPDAGREGHWNERPRDVANFVKWFARESERGDLNWQITNLTVPEAELHDAPFLYFAGNQPLRLRADQKAKVKAYVEQGGMLLFNSDCGGSKEPGQNPFVASVVGLMHELFPDDEFRDLPADHPIYAEPFSPKRWKQPPTLRGLTNGVRELAILLPDDPARTWQLQQTVGTGREEAYQSLYDIVLYGTDKRPLRTRGTPFLVARDENIKTDRTVKIGRLKYAGNWDPEPGGWRRLANVLHNHDGVDLDVRTVEFGKNELAGLPLVHMTGTTRFKLTDAQQDELKRYVAGGGTLLVDAAGGSPTFAQAAEGMLSTMYPPGLGDPLPPTDKIYSAFDPRFQVHYRPFAVQMLGRLTVPQVRAITVDDRPAVYYSREDLSGGLVGEPVDGVLGYDPETATDITAGIVLRATAGK